MSFSHWKKFDFFNITTFGADPQRSRSLSGSRTASFTGDELDASLISSISDIQSLKFATIVLGVFYIGVPSGKIFACAGDEVKFRLTAHSRNLYYLTKAKTRPLLLSIGLDEGEFNLRKCIKVWDISEPPIPREVNVISLPESMHTAATCFTVNAHFNKVAVGLKSGQIFMHLGDLTAKSFSKRILNIGNKTAEITNLFFLEKQSGCVLFYTTMTSVGSFLLKERGDVHIVLEEEHGCLPDNADLDEVTQRLVVSLQTMEAISVYYPECKGQMWSNEGPKSLVKCYRNQVCIASLKNNSQCQLAIYDIDNRFSGYLKSYTQVDQILIEEDGPFILSRNNKKEVVVQKLTEKPTHEKLKILFKKNNYEIAYSIAKAEGYQENFIADIIKRQGDHYYNKGDFDNAIIYYKQTVGYVEPSNIIIKFLDPNKIEFLTNYLEDLHKKHKATNEHTALLLNCYVHMKKPENLKNFLAKSDEDLELFDPRTAINVCCEAKCFDVALTLAEQHAMHSLYVKILIEDVGDYRKALSYMAQSMSISGCAKAFKEHGQALMKHEPGSAKETVFTVVRSLNLKNNLNNHLEPSDKDEVVKKEEDFFFDEPPEPTTLTYYQVLECFMSGLVNNLEDLDELLSDIIRKTPDIDQIIYHKLFELYLQQRKNVKDRQHGQSASMEQRTYEKKITDLLEDAKSKYDKNYVLMLLKMYDFTEGVVYICSLMGNKEELLYHFISASDYENIWRLCLQYGNSGEGNLWVQALTYFCGIDDPRSVEYIQKILQQIENQEFLTPLIVLEILSKNRRIKFGTVKNYLKNQLQRYYKTMDYDRSDFKANKEKIEKKKKEIHNLKTNAQKFQAQKCSACDMKLSLPSVHFMCGHSYHEHCLADGERECQLCFDLTQRAIEKKNELELQSHEHGNFYKELDESQDRFSVIARYFGRGLF